MHLSISQQHSWSCSEHSGCVPRVVTPNSKVPVQLEDAAYALAGQLSSSLLIHEPSHFQGLAWQCPGPFVRRLQ